MDVARSEICRANKLSIGEPSASLFSRSTNGLRHHRGKSSKLSRTMIALLEMFRARFLRLHVQESNGCRPAQTPAYTISTYTILQPINSYIRSTFIWH